VAKTHARDRARHPRRLERVVPGRPAGLHVAEAAPPGAGVAEDHERRRAPLPALAHVRAGRLLADRVQVLGADQLGERAVALTAGWRHLEPRRLSLAQWAHIRAEHAQHVHTPGVRPGPGGNRVDAVAHASTGSPIPSCAGWTSRGP